jgi:hypothetical protein
MVIAATTFALGERGVADDSGLIPPSPRGAAAILAAIFIPGRAGSCDAFSTGRREK